MATDPPAQLPTPALKRVRSKTIDGLNASRMRPSRATYFMICVGNKGCVAYLAPAVANSHKALLRGLMADDTGLKYHRGQCIFEEGCYTFVGPTLALGMRRKIELGLIELTGRRWRLKVRRGVVDDDDEDQRGSAELQSNG